MKDEQQILLLEALTQDVSKIQKQISTLIQMNQKVDRINEQIEVIYKRLERNTSQPTKSDSNSEITDKMLGELRLQIDRIILKLKKEDTFWNYYFTPARILVRSILLILLFISLGAAINQFLANAN